MLYAADTAASTTPPTAPPPSFTDRAKNVWNVYAPKAERIIDAPVYDTAAVLGVDVVWLGGILIALKLIGMGVWWEFFRHAKCECSVPPPSP